MLLRGEKMLNNTSIHGSFDECLKEEHGGAMKGRNGFRGCKNRPALPVRSSWSSRRLTVEGEGREGAQRGRAAKSAWSWKLKQSLCLLSWKVVGCSKISSAGEGRGHNCRLKAKAGYVLTGMCGVSRVPERKRREMGLGLGSVS